MATAPVTARFASARAVPDERWFFVGMAVLAMAIALVGFTWRYFLPLSRGSFHAAAVVHVHGVTMWSWTVLFFVQSWLAARGRIRFHRLLGMAGISLLTLAAWTGTVVALLQLERRLAAGEGDAARAFVALPLSLVVMMVPLFFAAILHARRAGFHARLMLMVTLVSLQPALARIVGAIRGGIAEPAVNGAVGGLTVLLLIGIAIAYDARTRPRPHPAYLWGGAWIVAVQVARLTLGHTPAWYATADVLATLVR